MVGNAPGLTCCPLYLTVKAIDVGHLCFYDPFIVLQPLLHYLSHAVLKCTTLIRKGQPLSPQLARSLPQPGSQQDQAPQMQQIEILAKRGCACPEALISIDQSKHLSDR